MAKIKSFYYRGQILEVDLDDEILQTHCALCFDNLTPRWLLEQDKQYTIGPDCIYAICFRCCSALTNVKSADEIKDERKEYQRSRRKSPTIRMSKKKQQSVIHRSKQLSKRPCGCGARGRHKASCSEGKK